MDWFVWTNITTMTTKARCFGLLTIFTIIILAVTSIFLRQTEIIQVSITTFLNQSLFSNSDDPSAEFVKFRKEYYLTSSAQNKSKFRESKLFIDYGPPISKIDQNISGTVSNKTKLILLWTTHYGNVNWMPNKICEGKENTCMVTSKKSDFQKSDAVFFHLIDFKAFPSSRPSHQRWVYFDHEPPYITKVLAKLKNFEPYNSIFNWTMTYRWDSDFPAPFYNSTPRETPLADGEFQNVLRSIQQKKQRLVAIMHRNCKPQSPRFKIVAELQKYIRVDFYGQCGNLSCPRNSKECTDKMSSYKFYLSFENSECRDYITEKVRFPLQEWDSVPIVFGAHPQTYAKVMPPNSFIAVKGFSSIKRLAEYITFLDKNPKFYAKYHAWRRNYIPAYSRFFTPERYCPLCQALFDPHLRSQTYRDFNGWRNEDSCQ